MLQLRIVKRMIIWGKYLRIRVGRFHDVVFGVFLQLNISLIPSVGSVTILMLIMLMLQLCQTDILEGS